MEEATLISIILAYVVTGISITGYDFSTPPLHRKGYVIQKRYSIAILIWFIWPFTLLTDIRQEQLLYKRGFRYFIGVPLMSLGFFFWGKLLIVVFTKFTGNFEIFSSDGNSKEITKSDFDSGLFEIRGKVIAIHCQPLHGRF
ncbi:MULTISPECIES: hypothetical protein [Aminobacterium]|jgi:hypothetical protein|uniref:hypothetical protein n=1 Tax=Aminobacterium TaxID=81466 RepID=UPI00257CEBB1|nr:hypothetical protein [Aminobacterium sp. UBA4987]